MTIVYFPFMHFVTPLPLLLYGLKHRLHMAIYVDEKLRFNKQKYSSCSLKRNFSSTKIAVCKRCFIGEGGGEGLGDQIRIIFNSYNLFNFANFVTFFLCSGYEGPHFFGFTKLSFKIEE